MAISQNKVLLMGYLGADPDVRRSKKGTAVANLSIATTEVWGRGDDRKESTEWHRVVLWGEQAEFADRSLRKGSGVHVEGRLQSRKWADKKGIERITTEIVGWNIQLLTEPPAGGGGDRRSDHRDDHDRRGSRSRGRDDRAGNRAGDRRDSGRSRGQERRDSRDYDERDERDERDAYDRGRR